VVWILAIIIIIIIISGIILLSYIFSLENSLNVFTEESLGGLQQKTLNRKFIAEELGFEIVDNDCNVPLLSLIVQSLRENKKLREIVPGDHY